MASPAVSSAPVIGWSLPDLATEFKSWTPEEKAEFLESLGHKFPEPEPEDSDEEPEFENSDEEETLDEDFCFGRIRVEGAKNKEYAEKFDAEFHSTYKLWGWKYNKGFIFLSRQCQSVPKSGQVLCQVCQHRKNLYDGGKNSSKSKWEGIWGQSPVNDSHTKGSAWSDKVLADTTP